MQNTALPLFLHTQIQQQSSSSSRRKKSSIMTGAPDLAAEVMQRVKSQADKKENALKRSKQMLFFELCNSLNVSPEEGKRMWGRMSPDDKMGLIKGFVSDWGLRFHPLSPSSIRDMVEEYVAADAEEGDSSEKNPDLGLTGSSSDAIFAGLKKFFMVLSQDD